MTQRVRTVFAAFMAVASAVLLTAAAQAAALFSDIGGSPYQQAIIKVGVTGVMTGGSDGTFKPDQPITRLQAVEALAAGLNVQGTGTIPNYKDLNDIPESVRPAIAALLNTGAASAQNAQVKDGDITYTLTTDKAVYGVDDPVDLTFTIANTGKSDAVFQFPSTQNYDFIIKRGSDELARWSLGQTFVQTPTSLTLAGGHAFSFTTRWLQRDQDSHSVPPGTYTLSALFPLKDHPVQVNLDFQKGLLTTFPDNTFRPNAQVTRAEFAALLVRAMGLQGEATQKAQASLSFKDAGDVPAPLHGYVAVAIDHKIMPLLPDGGWRPAQPTTRGDAAGALAAVMDSLNKFNYVKGTFVSVTGSNVTVSSINKTVTSYALTPSVAIYRNGKPAAAGDLKPNDQVVMLLTGPRGRAGYIEATGQ
ncbi:MAG TPA: S-layer homology domain-containing protein [bacterium]|nr:S-layer homology domain-containing protein [bacterium]